VSVALAVSVAAAVVTGGGAITSVEEAVGAVAVAVKAGAAMLL
jgi:hypothetical protein